jgi:nucleotide-binding universal stress UspA family protein
VGRGENEWEGQTMIRFKTILLPTDFSAHSRHALEVACAMARDQSARLILLHVVPRLAAAGAGDARALREAERAEEDFRGYREEMEEKLRQVQAEASWLQTEALLKEGGVADRILRTAAEMNCDLVVMGSHGATGATQFSLGSVAEEVTRKAPCPVLTINLPISGGRFVGAPVAACAGK